MGASELRLEGDPKRRTGVRSDGREMVTRPCPRGPGRAPAEATGGLSSARARPSPPRHGAGDESVGRSSARATAEASLAI